MTPKGTRPGTLPTAADAPIRARGDSPTRVAPASSRYTPPQPKYIKESPRWVPIVMFALLILGALMIICNYLEFVLPGAANNWYLLGGLALILGGIITATQYR